MPTDRLSPRQWLSALGVLVAGSMSIADAKERLGTYCPLLEGEFSPEVFNRRSLAFVAQRQKFFPSFNEVCTLLGEWGETQPKPKPLALPEPPPLPPRPPPTADEVAYVHARVQQIVANMRSTTIMHDTEGRKLEDEPRGLRPRYLSPVQLDQINPLPDGRKRA